MDVATEPGLLRSLSSLDGDELDLSFLPSTLARQCRSLIESYHEVHGFASLPNMLWQFRLGPLIERHDELRCLLRKASTTRSAKVANTAFVEIATAILALEILTSNFAGWSLIYSAASERARNILQRNRQKTHMPLMDFYLYPPKQISTAAIAALATPQHRIDDETGLDRTSKPELSSEKRALQYACLLRDARDSGRIEISLQP